MGVERVGAAQGADRPLREEVRGGAHRRRGVVGRALELRQKPRSVEPSKGRLKRVIRKLSLGVRHTWVWEEGDVRGLNSKTHFCVKIGIIQPLLLLCFEHAQGGAALQIRAYLALVVVLEVTLGVFGFSSLYVYLGRNPGKRHRAEQEPSERQEARASHMGRRWLSRRGPLLAAHGNSGLFEQRALLRRAHGVHVHGRGHHGRSGGD